MKHSAGFVGPTGTENSRTILAVYDVMQAAGLEGDLNLLMRDPHAEAINFLNYAKRYCKGNEINLYLTDETSRPKWEKLSRANGWGDIKPYTEFYPDSYFVMVGSPGKKELPSVEDALANDCYVSLMGGAKRKAIRDGLRESKKVKLTDELGSNLSMPFFFGLENYERFQAEKPKIVQCTSCNTTGLSLLTLAAKPLGLEAVTGVIARRMNDPHSEAKGYASSVQFGNDAGHQGKDAHTVFPEVDLSIRAAKVPTELPHTNFLNLIFKGRVEPEQLAAALAKTRRIVEMPYESEEKTYDSTGTILKLYETGLVRSISPEIFELLVSDATIPIYRPNETILQTVSMVEQMSIAVPNHVESYLLSIGYPAGEVHDAVDKALDIKHGIWPDRLTN